jgi:hypothetical protein
LVIILKIFDIVISFLTMLEMEFLIQSMFHLIKYFNILIYILTFDYGSFPMLGNSQKMGEDCLHLEANSHLESYKLSFFFTQGLKFKFFNSHYELIEF